MRRLARKSQSGNIVNVMKFSSSNNDGIRHGRMTPENFDVIVVGAGTAGCMVTLESLKSFCTGMLRNFIRQEL